LQVIPPLFVHKDEYRALVHPPGSAAVAADLLRRGERSMPPLDIHRGQRSYGAATPSTRASAPGWIGVHLNLGYAYL